MLPVQGKDGFYHPESEQEIIDLILHAREKGITIRVRGSGHSVPQAIYTDNFPYLEAEQFSPGLVQNVYTENFDDVDVENGQIQMMLDKMYAIRFETDVSGATIARVQAGCHLADDPYDPTEKSTYFDSFFYQLESRGFAVPDTGGISHQSVGGFLATGSSGGSLKRSIEESIVGFRFIDGNGVIHDCSPSNNPDEFYAVGVSVGLLGIVTEVTFKPVPRFDIKGSESIRPISDYAGEIDFFGTSSIDLKNYLYNNEYTRLLWWPQKNVEKMTVWTARQMKTEDYNKSNSKIDDGVRILKPKPYQEVFWVFGSPIMFEYFGDLFYTAVANWPTWLYTYIKKSWLRMFVEATVEALWVKPIFPWLLNQFVQTDRKKDGKWQPQEFHDTWWRGLPMDNQMDDRLMPVVFTEIWVAMEDTAKVMTDLKNHFDKGGLKATGTFSFELYATKASEFWMSPAYKKDVFRVDVFLSGKNSGSPADFYQQFWDILAPYDFRCHWGKWIPGNPAHESDMAKWRAYTRQQFPMWDKFLEMRERFDPQQVFVNEYWRAKFGITRLPNRPAIKATDYTTKGPIVKGDDGQTVRPNNALLTGVSGNPKATPIMYIASLLYSSVFVLGWELMMSNVLKWVPFASTTVEWVVVGFVCVATGIGTVYTRYFSPILIAFVMSILVMIANVANAMSGGEWWQWHAQWGMSTFIFGCLVDSFLAIVFPIISWLIGRKLFSSRWPQ